MLGKHFARARAFDLATNSAHCGECSKSCAAGSRCVQAACACQGELKSCGSGCIDVTNDVEHCEDATSPATPVSSAAPGACDCQSGLTTCDETCTDTSSDGANCGSCGNASPAGQVCSQARCAEMCAQNLVQCGSSCVESSEQRATLRQLQQRVPRRTDLHRRRLRLPVGSDLLWRPVRGHECQRRPLRRLRHRLYWGPNLREWIVRVPERAILLRGQLPERDERSLELRQLRQPLRAGRELLGRKLRRRNWRRGRHGWRRRRRRAGGNGGASGSLGGAGASGRDGSAGTSGAGGSAGSAGTGGAGGTGGGVLTLLGNFGQHDGGSRVAPGSGRDGLSRVLLEHPGGESRRRAPLRQSRACHGAPRAHERQRLLLRGERALTERRRPAVERGERDARRRMGARGARRRRLQRRGQWRARFSLADQKPRAGFAAA